MIGQDQRIFSLSNLVFYATALVYLLLAIFKFPGNIISWDVFGYYLYLPFTFIYHDIELKNEQRIWDIINTYHNTATLYQTVKLESGAHIMKYSMGLAVLYAPFFFLGHIFAGLTKYPADGFSLPYQVSLFIGCLFYTLAGMYFLRKILLRFFSERVTAITFLLIVFGTNYLAHTGIHGQGAMPHNLLFSLYAALIYFTIKFHEKFSYKYAIICGLLIGLMALSRPTEIIAIFIPLLWNVASVNDLKDKWSVIFKNFKKFYALFICMGAVGVLQFLYWKMHVGTFTFNSYGGNAGEGFEFSHPYIAEVLFSFRKGWFIYTPIMFITVIAIPLIKIETFFVPLLVYLVLNLYIVSSWSCWWYADSFSQRPLVPSYAFLALPLGAVINKLFNLKQKGIKILLFGMIGFLVVLNLFQTWQLDRGILDPQRMTKAYYKSTFFQTKPASEEQKKLLLVQRNADGKETLTGEEADKLQPAFSTEMRFDERKNDFFTDTLKGISKYAMWMSDKNPFTPAMDFPYDQLTKKHYAWIKVSAHVWIPEQEGNLEGKLVVSFRHNDFDYKYKAFDIASVKPQNNSWQDVSFYYLTPEVRSTEDIMRFYMWNPGKRGMYVDYIKIESFEPKVDESFF